MQPGDKVIDTLKILNNGFPINLTKLIGDVVTVEYFEAENDGRHVVIEVEKKRLEKFV
jgi:hypothetical protein